MCSADTGPKSSEANSVEGRLNLHVMKSARRLKIPTEQIGHDSSHGMNLSRLNNARVSCTVPRFEQFRATIMYFKWDADLKQTPMSCLVKRELAADLSPGHKKTPLSALIGHCFILRDRQILAYAVPETQRATGRGHSALLHVIPHAPYSKPRARSAQLAGSIIELR